MNKFYSFNLQINNGQEEFNLKINVGEFIIINKKDLKNFNILLVLYILFFNKNNIYYNY